jgi:hypothetical protein
MATLYITEYIDIDGSRQVPREPPIAQQTVAIGGSSTASAQFNSQTSVIRIHTDAICSVLVSQLVGGNPVAATAASGRLALGQTEYRGVPTGGGYVISVITNS